MGRQRTCVRQSASVIRERCRCFCISSMGNGNNRNNQQNNGQSVAWGHKRYSKGRRNWTGLNPTRRTSLRKRVRTQFFLFYLFILLYLSKALICHLSAYIFS